MAWEDWNDKATAMLWNDALDLIENSALTLADIHRNEAQITVSRTHWDNPEVELRWLNHSSARGVFVEIEGKKWPLKIRCSGAVWRDVDTDTGGQVRDSKSEVFAESSVDSIATLDRFLQSSLERVLYQTAKLRLERKREAGRSGA